jgi:hypothetical protein
LTKILEKGPPEVDFALQHGQGVVSIKVKAEENLKMKSLCRTVCSQTGNKVFNSGLLETGLDGERTAVWSYLLNE